MKPSSLAITTIGTVDIPPQTPFRYAMAAWPVQDRVRYSLFAGHAMTPLPSSLLCFFGFLAMIAPSGVANAADMACRKLGNYASTSRDAASVVQDCIDRSRTGDTVALPPGRYVVRHPIVMSRPLTLHTQGLSASDAPCTAVDRRCAALALVPTPIGPAGRLFIVRGDDITIDHLIFTGIRTADPATAERLCLGGTPDRERAGGVSVKGDRLRINGSVFRDFACLTALGFSGGSAAMITDNLIIDNGTHDHKMMWSDGMTVWEAEGMTVRRNKFLDNTDVQLIFGGCRGCTITANRFRHSGSVAGGAFAEIMLQAWPGQTSGRYDNSRTTGNDVDCGTARRCGFGLMLGSAPWYPAPASGGAVTGNRIANAMLAINVDGLSGPMTIAGNSVSMGPRNAISDCGTRAIDAPVNVAPASRRFVDMVEPTMRGASAISFAGCILNAAPQ